MNPLENFENQLIDHETSSLESSKSAVPTQLPIDSPKLDNPCPIKQPGTGPIRNKSQNRTDKRARTIEKARGNHFNEIKELVKYITDQQKLGREIYRATSLAPPQPTKQDYLTKYLSYIDARLRVMTEDKIKNAIKQFNNIMDEVDKE